MLQACSCTNMMLYPKTNNRKEFWSQLSDPIIDKANLKMLYKLECLQTDLDNSEFSEKNHIITNKNKNKNTFWNSFRNALIFNKHSQNRKIQILSIIANEFIYLQLYEKLQIKNLCRHFRKNFEHHLKVESDKKVLHNNSEYIVIYLLPYFGTSVYFSPAEVAGLCNNELHHSEPKTSTHTKPQSKWTIVLPKSQ
ncbi:20351_t:CDS:2, partial [Racocetra persica]